MLYPFYFAFAYLVCPIVLLVLFHRKKPRLAPLTLILCPVIDFIIYHREFFYYESQGLMLLFTAAQVALTAIPAFIIWAKGRK